LNIASFGLTGESALWLEEQARAGKRNKLSYGLSGLVGLSRFRSPRVRISVDGKVLHDEVLTFAVVANGQFFAGGMRVAPMAEIDDGALDVVVAPKLAVPSALRRFPSVIRGTHVRDPRFKHGRGSVIEASAEGGGPVWIEADGEAIGTLPASVSIAKGAILLGGMP
jgi:diacylglycerol kinase family enzyme